MHHTTGALLSSPDSRYYKARDYNYKVFGGGLLLPTPWPDEKGTGYHAIAAIGYDERGIKIQNSWGTGWGDGGFAILLWGYSLTREVDGSG